MNPRITPSICIALVAAAMPCQAAPPVELAITAPETTHAYAIVPVDVSIHVEGSAYGGFGLWERMRVEVVDADTGEPVYTGPAEPARPEEMPALRWPWLQGSRSHSLTLACKWGEAEAGEPADVLFAEPGRYHLRLSHVFGPPDRRIRRTSPWQEIVVRDAPEPQQAALAAVKALPRPDLLFTPDELGRLTRDERQQWLASLETFVDEHADTYWTPFAHLSLARTHLIHGLGPAGERDRDALEQALHHLAKASEHDGFLWQADARQPLRPFERILHRLDDADAEREAGAEQHLDREALRRRLRAHFDHTAARLALDLVEQQRWHEAVWLLEALPDAAFVIPEHAEIMHIGEDGTHYHEWVPAISLGNREAALARCYFQLGWAGEAEPLAWEVLEAGAWEPPLLRLLARHLAETDQWEANAPRIEALREPVADEERSATARRERSAVYLEVARAMDAGDFEPAVALIRHGAPRIDSGASPDAQLKAMICLDLAERPAEAVPHLIQVLADHNARNTGDEPRWVVYTLGLCRDRRALAPLRTYADQQRNAHIQLTIHAAIERIRGVDPGDANDVPAWNRRRDGNRADHLGR
ncbi:MAG: hypothetical protein WD534_03070 [Phycisphaeraceae bacterium]